MSVSRSDVLAVLARCLPAPTPLAAAIAVAAGIAIAPLADSFGVAGGAPWLRWLIAAAAVVAARRYRALVLVAGFAFGAARGARPPVVAPGGVVIDDRGPDRVIGVVRGPIAHGPRGDAALLDTGDAALWLWTDQHLVPGERVAVTGVVHTPRGLRDPAVPDRASAARARGADLEVTARSLERLGDAGGPVDRAWRWAGATQAAWARAIDRAGGDAIGRAALRGIAVGDRGEVPPALDQRWRDVGIFHVLSVSGLHLAVVAGLAFGLLRRLIAASPWGGRTRPARWAAPPALVLAVGYTMITGAQLATLRSLVVIALVALGVAALAILVWRPADLLDPSFQLSFVAALTLALGSANGERRRGLRGWVMRGLTSSAWVALTTAPLTAYHFQQVAAGGVLGNLVLTPLVELVALPLGLAGVVLGIAPAITVAAWIVGLADRGAGLLAMITPVGHVAVASATVMMILVALSLGLAARTGRPGWRDRVTAALWLALCLVWSLGRSPPPPGARGLADRCRRQSRRARSRAGRGAGPRDRPRARGLRSPADRARDPVASASRSLPRARGGRDADRRAVDGRGDRRRARGRSVRCSEAGGTVGPGRLRGLDASCAPRVRRDRRPDRRARHADRASLAGCGAPRGRGRAIGVGAALPAGGRRVGSLRNRSGAHGQRQLARGRAHLPRPHDRLRRRRRGRGRGRADKVAHHGSPTSSTAGFVAATRPGLAVISCGPANAFGFPSPEVVERWRTAGAEIARTDRDGAITVTIDREGGLAIDRHVP
ncbi:MAG: hypothetical protein E6J91_26330 [Deltaproteobacteria bacterium]|nr:MAG: hypothetical protein E6J91_26330 [Deltaproteobacteria bacterium]